MHRNGSVDLHDGLTDRRFRRGLDSQGPRSTRMGPVALGDFPLQFTLSSLRHVTVGHQPSVSAGRARSSPRLRFRSYTPFSWQVSAEIESSERSLKIRKKLAQADAKRRAGPARPHSIQVGRPALPHPTANHLPRRGYAPSLLSTTLTTSDPRPPPLDPLGQRCAQQILRNTQVVSSSKGGSKGTDPIITLGAELGRAVCGWRVRAGVAQSPDRFSASKRRLGSPLGWECGG